MAEATAVTHVTGVQCGFCLKEGGTLETPKSLPCSHVHCLICLKDSWDVNGIVRCPYCREAFDVTIEDLPSTDQKEDNSIYCNVCTTKGVKKEPAVSFCTPCSKLFCAKHLELHEEINEDHPKITIDEYRLQAKKLNVKMCAVHDDTPYIMGCGNCVTVMCVKCISAAGLCTEGSAHQLLTLEELVRDLSKIDDIREREDKLSALFKQTSKIISDFDTETKDLLKILHNQRDQQLEAIQLKYVKLEEEFLEHRRETKSDMTRFMEENVGVKWFDMSQIRIRVEAQLKRSNEVDIVREYAKSRDDMEKLLSVEMPELELPDIMTIEVKEERREVELEVTSAGDGCISVDKGLTISALPKSLTLLKTVQVSSHSISICQYDGKTYVGYTTKAVDRIDDNNQLTKSFITSAGRTDGIRVYQDRIYTVVCGNPFTINVYDLMGKPITSWTHSGSSSSNTKFALVDSKVIVPDNANSRLTVYSLTGEVIKYLPCPPIKGSTAICEADSHSVVVSTGSPSQVFKIDTSTGECKWICRDVPSPLSVTCYKSKYVLVSGDYINKTTIWILDMKTGKMLSQISDPTERTKCNVFDLQVVGQTLIVPRYQECQVLYYRIK